MKVIGFCGLPGSGKSTAIQSISDLGKIVTMGDVIRNEAKKRGIEPSGENLGKIAKELRELGGPEIVAKKCVELINESGEEIVFVDGLRSMSEVNTFRLSWKFPIIATDISEIDRFKRLSERGRSDDPKTIEGLRERDDREINFGVKEVVDNAQYKITNIGSVEELNEKTRKLILDILENY